MPASADSPRRWPNLVILIGPPSLFNVTSARVGVAVLLQIITPSLP